VRAARVFPADHAWPVMPGQSFGRGFSNMKTGIWLSSTVLALAAISVMSAGPHAALQPVAASQPALEQQKSPTLTAGTVDAATRARLVESVAKAPMSFEANQGQTDNRVKFLSRGLGYTLFLTSSDAVLALQKPAETRKQNQPSGAMQDPLGVGTVAPPHAVAQPAASAAQTTINGVLRMRLVGANSAPHISGLEESSAKSNYYIGNDPTKWRTNVPNFGRVQYASIYPGVDLVFYGNQRQLEYDFIVAPGTDPSTIALAFDGDRTAKNVSVKINDAGELVAHLASGNISFHKPVVYQPAAGRTQQKQTIDGNYVLKADGSVGFELGPYDHARKLVIDPIISWSSYLGGSNIDMATGVGVDKYTDVVIAGSTRSADFPVFDPLETFHGGTCDGMPCRDVFVSKFSPTGTALQYSTYIGGTNDDVASDIVLDMAGDMFVVGYTLSTDFPVTSRAFQKTFGGGTVTGDAFVFELASKGIGLEYATYLGGSSDDQAYSITVQYTPTNVPNVFVVGSTASTNFPVTNGAFQTVCGLNAQGSCANGFASQLNSKGSALVYSTYLGGSNGLGDAAYGVAVDSNDDAYITGITGSPNFPTTSGAFQTICGTDGLCNGSFDGFVTELNPTGTALVASTFLGGDSYDYTAGVALDQNGGIYVSGNTISTDFPTTAGAAQTTFGGMSAGCSPTSGSICGDVTVTKFNPGLETLAYSTYLGGSLDEYPGISMAVDSAGNAYVTGQTDSLNFPLAAAFQTTYGGGSSDAFVTMVNSTGSAFTYSTYLGGNGQDFGYRTVLDPSANVYVSGGTISTNFPVKAGEFQTICGTDGTCNGGLMDAWVAKIIMSADVAVSMSVPSTVESGANLTYTLGVQNDGPDTAVAVVATDATPTGTTFYSVSTTEGTCTSPQQGQTGTVTCNVNSLPAGGHFTITLVVNVNAASGSVISDTFSAESSTYDSKKGNGSGTKKTTVD
jgi:uncharacterized repeat protein (TIGR01451 family)